MSVIDAAEFANFRDAIKVLGKWQKVVRDAIEQLHAINEPLQSSSLASVVKTRVKALDLSRSIAVETVLILVDLEQLDSAALKFVAEFVTTDLDELAFPREVRERANALGKRIDVLHEQWLDLSNEKEPSFAIELEEWNETVKSKTVHAVRKKLEKGPSLDNAIPTLNLYQAFDADALADWTSEEIDAELAKRHQA